MPTEPTVCDGTTAALLITDPDARLLLVERTDTDTPHALAPPSGHVSDHKIPERASDTLAYLTAAVAVTRDQTRLTVQPADCALTLERWSASHCTRPLAPRARPGHGWQVFTTTKWTGEPDTTRGVLSLTWVTRTELEFLARRTIAYITGALDRTAFEGDPGLDPIWVWWFHCLQMLPNLADRDREVLACAEYAESPRAF